MYYLRLEIRCKIGRRDLTNMVIHVAIMMNSCLAQRYLDYMGAVQLRRSGGMTQTIESGFKSI